MTSQQFPTRKLLAEVNPETLEKLPPSYKGSTANVHLAYAFGKAIENGLTYEQILASKPTVPDYFQSADSKKYAEMLLKFGASEDVLTSYYDLLAVFDKSSLTLPQIYFGVALAMRYPNDTLTGAISTFRAIYEYQVGYLGRAQSKVVLPSIADFDNSSALGRLLRSEGIIMPQANLWVASSHWTPEEVILMLEEGLNLEKAMELYLLGFTTMEEIISYGEILPDSWIDRILNGPPKVD